MRNLNYFLTYDDLKVIHDIVGNNVAISVAPNGNSFVIRLNTTIDGEDFSYYRLFSFENEQFKDPSGRKKLLTFFAQGAARALISMREVDS